MVVSTFPSLLALAPAAGPSLVMVVPFALMLLCMATMPLLVPAMWARSYKWISIGLGLGCTLYYLFFLHVPARMIGAAMEYISFIVFIGSLYVISGGIHIRVKGEAKPWVNCAFLLTGALLANLVGTTGASMLLIRPWIRMNKYRFTNFHTAFFIFIVSNVGGCLTPIGDPPLFLGYLNGVPFWWIASRCVPAWAVAVTALVTIFYLIDRFNFVQAPRRVREAETAQETWKIEGLSNFVFLGFVLAAIFLKGSPLLRSFVMAAAAVASYRSTAARVHAANDFSFGPIKEIAWLFAGIFATMVPALDYVQENAVALGIRDPIQFYWFSGALSSVLDNAPTYLAFSAAAFGLKHLHIDHADDMAYFLRHDGTYLVAISLGSVFFGAMTYIGNGPNLMVKAIADHANVHTPHFFAYIFKFSMLVLLPVLALISFLFFTWHIF
jgi:Na+/H+ antiporter NhaD/arsenite permease-like protein